MNEHFQQVLHSTAPLILESKLFVLIKYSPFCKLKRQFKFTENECLHRILNSKAPLILEQYFHFHNMFSSLPTTTGVRI